MEDVGVFLGIGHTLSLHGGHMQKDALPHLPGPAQLLFQLHHVVSVHRAHVIKPQIVKNRAGQGLVLDPFLAPVQQLAYLGESLHHLVILPLEIQIGGIDPGAAEPAGHAAHVGVDGHAVVVEHHDHGLAALPQIAESLIAQSAGKGAVAHDGHHLIIHLLQRPRPGHAQRHGDGVGGVARHKGVAHALGGLGEACKASELTQGVELPGAAGEDLMHIALVAHVEENTIHRRVIDPVQRHSQFHGPQIGGQVPARGGDFVHQKFPQLHAELQKLLILQRQQIRAGAESIQYIQSVALYICKVNQLYIVHPPS